VVSCGGLPVVLGFVGFVAGDLWELGDGVNENMARKTWRERGEKMVETWRERGR
jgi:hypothetical protein